MVTLYDPVASLPKFLAPHTIGWVCLLSPPPTGSCYWGPPLSHLLLLTNLLPEDFLPLLESICISLHFPLFVSHCTWLQWVNFPSSACLEQQQVDRCCWGKFHPTSWYPQPTAFSHTPPCDATDTILCRSEDPGSFLTLCRLCANYTWFSYLLST